MSIENDLIFNIYLILTAGIVDTAWYIVLTFMVTSNVALDFIKNKSKILQKIIGVVFLFIGLIFIISSINRFLFDDFITSNSNSWLF